MNLKYRKLANTTNPSISRFEISHLASLVHTYGMPTVACEFNCLSFCR